MKMIVANGAAITDYQSYVFNYTKGQYNYKIPANGLNAIQLYVPLGEYGTGVPGSQGYQLIHTCGADAGTIEDITAANYVAGVDANNVAYMVITGFNETTTASCYVIAATLDGILWFSQEYSSDGCGGGLNFGASCYGNLDPLISYDTEGIYFGQSQGSTAGDATIVYQHIFYMRQAELTVSGIKNEFKQGRTRTFRTESVDLYLFWGELVPEWYIKHVDAVFKRGEVTIGVFPAIYSFPVTKFIDAAGIKYLVDSTNYEKVDECFKSWKPNATLKENFFNSFSCEVDPCQFIQQGTGGGGTTPTCCDPTIISAVTEWTGEGNTITVNFEGCTPAPSGGYTLYYRRIGDSSFILFGTVDAGTVVINNGGVEGDQFEGFIFSNCGGGLVGNNVNWSTSGTTPSSYSLEIVSPCSAGYTPLIISGGVEGDSVVITVTFSGNMAKTSGLFVRADLKVRSPYITDPPTFSPIPEMNDSSICYTDTIGHGFNVVINMTIIMPAGGAATFDLFAIVNNSNPVIPKGVLIEVTSVNGSGVSGVSAIGCAGDSVTGGTC